MLRDLAWLALSIWTKHAFPRLAILPNGIQWCFRSWKCHASTKCCRSQATGLQHWSGASRVEGGTSCQVGVSQTGPAFWILQRQGQYHSFKHQVLYQRCCSQPICPYPSTSTHGSSWDTPSTTLESPGTGDPWSVFLELSSVTVLELTLKFWVVQTSNLLLLNQHVLPRVYIPFLGDPRIKLFRHKMSLVCQKDRIKLDAWTAKSMLSFIKMKTHKNLGSVDSWMDLVVRRFWNLVGFIPNYIESPTQFISWRPDKSLYTNLRYLVDLILFWGKLYNLNLEHIWWKQNPLLDPGSGLSGPPAHPQSCDPGLVWGMYCMNCYFENCSISTHRPTLVDLR